MNVSKKCREMTGFCVMLTSPLGIMKTRRQGQLVQESEKAPVPAKGPTPEIFVAY